MTNKLIPNYFYTKDGIRLFYQTNYTNQLDKPLLIFNYGLICNNKHWKPQIEYKKTILDLLTYWRDRIKKDGNVFLTR